MPIADHILTERVRKFAKNPKDWIVVTDTSAKFNSGWISFTIQTNTTFAFDGCVLTIDYNGIKARLEGDTSEIARFLQATYIETKSNPARFIERCLLNDQYDNCNFQPYKGA